MTPSHTFSQRRASDSDHVEGPGTSRTFEELQQERRTGVAGLEGGKRGTRSTALKRVSKNQPQILSSTKPVPRFREVLQIPRSGRLDPRFEALPGGEGNPKFRKQYAFLFDEQLPAEKEGIKKALKGARSAQATKDLQAKLTRVQQQLSTEQARRAEEQWDLAQKAQTRNTIAQGKKPYYPKKNEKRRQDLVHRYEVLKTTGKLQKVIEKKAKKNAAKDHRFVPSARRAPSL